MGDTCLLSLAGTHLPDPLQLHLYCSLSGRDDREGDGGVGAVLGLSVSWGARGGGLERLTTVGAQGWGPQGGGGQ